MRTEGRGLEVLESEIMLDEQRHSEWLRLTA